MAPSVAPAAVMVSASVLSSGVVVLPSASEDCRLSQPTQLCWYDQFGHLWEVRGSVELLDDALSSMPLFGVLPQMLTAVLCVTEEGAVLAKLDLI